MPTSAPGHPHDNANASPHESPVSDVASSQGANPGIWHGTTILTVRKGGRVVIAGDGQVSLGATVIKANARKVRSVGKGDVIGGFPGAPPDAFPLSSGA